MSLLRVALLVIAFGVLFAYVAAGFADTDLGPCAGGCFEDTP